MVVRGVRMNGSDESDDPACPPERNNSLLVGLGLLLGPPIGLIAGLVVWGRTIPNLAFLFGLASVLTALAIELLERLDPEVAIPQPTRAERVRGAVVAMFNGVVVATAIVVGLWWLGQHLPHASTREGWLAIFGAALLIDFGYYAIHRWLYHGRGRSSFARWCRRTHALHHRIPQLDFLRGNEASFADTAVLSFAVPGGIICAALGMTLVDTLVSFALILMLQAKDHVNYALNFGWLRRLFIDNHAHKLHHCRGGAHINFATGLAWDRLFGSYHEDRRRSPAHMFVAGLAIERDHHS